MAAIIHTMLIWEEIPEDTRIFLIPNGVISKEQRDLLRSAHGTYINVTEDDSAANAVQDYILDLSEGEKPSGDKGSWTQFLVFDTEKTELMENIMISAVYHSGFYL